MPLRGIETGSSRYRAVVSVLLSGAVRPPAGFSSDAGSRADGWRLDHAARRSQAPLNPRFLFDLEDGLDLDSDLVREGLQADRRAGMDTLLAEYFKIEL